MPLPPNEHKPIPAIPKLGGLDSRYDREPGKAEFLLNCWRSNGLLRARPPFVARFGRGYFGVVLGAYGFNDWDGNPRCALVHTGTSRGDNQGMFFSLTRVAGGLNKQGGVPDANLLLFSKDLTITHDIAHDDRTQWCFEEMFGRLYFSSPNAGYFIFDCRKAGDSAESVYVPSTPGPDMISDDTSGYYSETIPAGVMKNLNNIMYYGAFRRGIFTLPQTQPVPSVSPSVQLDMVLNSNRTLIAFDHRMVMYSEPKCPWNVADLAFETVENKEPLTGLAVLGGRLIVTSPNGYYTFDVGDWGTGVRSVQIQAVFLGSGNIARLGQQETEAGLLSLGSDGVYGFDGQNAPTYLTGPIEGFFRDDGIGTLPSILEQMLDTNYGIKLPLRISKHRRHESVSANLRTRGLYLLAVPLEGEDGCRCILVFDYRNAEWFIWLTTETVNDPAGQITAMTVHRDLQSGTETLILGMRDGSLYHMPADSTAQPVDYLANGHTVAFPCIWQTVVMFGTDMQKSLDLVRVRCRHAQKAGASLPGYVFAETEEGVWLANEVATISNPTSWPESQKLKAIQSAPDATSGAAYDAYWDTGKWDQPPFARRDFVTVKIGMGIACSDWIRVGLYWPSNVPRTGFYSLSLDLREEQKA